MNDLAGSLKGRDFLSLKDFSREEIFYLLDLADDLKAKLKKREPHPLLAGKTLGMIFTKRSTRTRVSFEVGMYQLGGYPLFLTKDDLQLGRGETIADTARVLSRYLDGIMIRTYSHREVEELAEYASIPVINGLTDFLHPTQALADIMTIREWKGKLQGLNLTFIGDGNNVAHSLMYGGAKVGLNVTIACPSGYEPMPQVVEEARRIAAGNGCQIAVTNNIKEAAEGADILYTDVWASMGQEDEAEKRRQAFRKYQINSELLKLAKPDAMVLHCLPAHRGEEITDEVMDGPQSAVFDEAENRLHAHKAIMVALMG
ncbi:ornithine carbamoyltransferase [Neomoorella thermoacetica]|uniref:Ornithine carbamoyltransferase n=3 Tax=Neomoorella thermoacetica TaxID=1525 RepID=A0A1D7XEC2_NEOTH|nr:ornithine carbamoyltransferase [Moorella thermoacetica]MDN5326089.1 ornithine carbamoyltransferase [Moorella sp. (in: firmicutes)]AKX95139.1 ornithine carbamoyltransferase [Moorella thermoacetica]AKX97764.1 ornithine carbamoyltransferase [Moorella thermoacetica]AOQ25260.1 Ornithine carbamoyltransferase [Moorella thermoacetica]APC09488.1 ornithine carbamoyltransferase [Moorella thermoacetica]